MPPSGWSRMDRLTNHRYIWARYSECEQQSQADGGGGGASRLRRDQERGEDVGSGSDASWDSDGSLEIEDEDYPCEVDDPEYGEFFAVARAGRALARLPHDLHVLLEPWYKEALFKVYARVLDLGMVLQPEAYEGEILEPPPAEIRDRFNGRGIERLRRMLSRTSHLSQYIYISKLRLARWLTRWSECSPHVNRRVEERRRLTFEEQRIMEEVAFLRKYYVRRVYIKALIAFKTPER